MKDQYSRVYAPVATVDVYGSCFDWLVIFWCQHFCWIFSVISGTKINEYS